MYDPFMWLSYHDCDSRARHPSEGYPQARIYLYLHVFKLKLQFIAHRDIISLKLMVKTLKGEDFVYIKQLNGARCLFLHNPAWKTWYSIMFCSFTRLITSEATSKWSCNAAVQLHCTCFPILVFPDHSRQSLLLSTRLLLVADLHSS